MLTKRGVAATTGGTAPTATDGSRKISGGRIRWAVHWRAADAGA
jgi:hypothetical protein